MRIVLALRNLAHSKVRTLVAMSGVCFAVTLLFMQLGFFASVLLTATLVYDVLDFDLVLTSPHYVLLTQPGSFPQRRLHQAQANGEVDAVMPVYVRRQVWRNPETRLRRGVAVLGFKPTDPVSRLPELAQQLPGLARPNTVLVDRLTRPEVGRLDTGLVTEVGPHSLQIIGRFTIGTGFEAGLIVVSDQTFSRILGGYPLTDVSLGLVKLRPGADPRQVAQGLRRSLPADVRVLTRSEISAQECRYWVTNTSTGIIFGCGVIVAVLLNIVITYQVLSLEVTHRLSEYATLKAVGFSDAYLSRVVLQQALIFAVVSFVPGYVFAMAIYFLGGNVTKLPISMTVARCLSVFVINVLACCLSALLALRILRRADPVDLF